ncbi:DeoR/GlpR family DNA-binding transcription regulator [Streptomyces sp. NBC_01233]|uniref:DeoR/GlpR family DNA-binding transcription regulator n=1 Tax=Streptomyces sp. NBC_01233 TaxID=2903787 RepID=UPI002E138CDA|nr:DeoR/GlpR family DNA-binding transcription regulator [Streptomyces sp. NBC_01233]
MDTHRRRAEILALARRDGAVQVAQLATTLGVAQETVRRDLRVLEDSGLVRRTYGGAYPVETAAFESSLASRATRHLAQKARIASAAAALLGEAETLFIDEGFTPRLIAEALPRDRRLVVITASLAVASVLAAREETQVLLLGGRVRGGTMATVDHWATSMLSGFVIDLAYVGANGISREYGLTTPDTAVGKVKAQAIKSARRRVFSGIHTKFGSVSFCRFGEVNDFDTIITGTSLPLMEAQRYVRLGPQVVRV